MCKVRAPRSHAFLNKGKLRGAELMPKFGNVPLQGPYLLPESRIVFLITDHALKRQDIKHQQKISSVSRGGSLVTQLMY
jgi:hypothetical protein